MEGVFLPFVISGSGIGGMIMYLTIKILCWIQRFMLCLIICKH